MVDWVSGYTSVFPSPDTIQYELLFRLQTSHHNTKHRPTKTQYTSKVFAIESHLSPLTVFEYGHFAKLCDH